MSSTLSFIHFDTTDATMKKSSFDCTFQLATPIKHLYKVYLKSVELPVGWFNVREDQLFQIVYTNSLGLFLGSNALVQAQFNNVNITTIANTAYGPFYVIPVQFIVPASTYSLESLITFINNNIISFINDCKNINPNFTKLEGLYAMGVPISGDYYSNAQITFQPGFSVIIGNTPLMTDILGFDAYQRNELIGIITAPRLYKLFNDTYLNLYFPNIPHNNTNFNNKFCSFKIPVSTGFQTILYSGDSKDFSQYILITDPNFVLNQLSIKVLDRFGKEITNGTLYDWSFTLGFEIMEQPRNLLTYVLPEPVKK